MRKTWKQRLVALALAACTILGLGLPAQAISIADGSKTCTVALAPVHNYLTTTAGTSLRAGGYNYTTDDGLTGPAYCIDHGLDYTGKVLPITGKYTASPATAGAFANGYPQMPLQTWLDMNLPQNSILNGLTEDEYRYATQVAVWATLGQLGVDGTKFTAGREYLNPPTGDTQQSRVFRAVQLILSVAANWDRVYQTGMYIRLTENALGGNIAIPAHMTLEYAADRNEYGIKREVINGKSYFTREYIFASATSTYYQDYTIDLWATGCPAGTIFTDLSNNELPRSKWHETDTWRSPATLNGTNLNYNGFEYWTKAKLCIPVETAPNSGEITLHCAALVMQYEIYLANNEDNSQQSYIIADPSKGTKEADAVLSWGSIITEQAYLKVIKVGGGGIVLPGATFTLTGSDGSSYTGTTDERGEIFWNKLKPGVVYTLTEANPPAGYSAIEPRTLTLKAGHIEYLTIQDDTLHTLTVRKVDRQTGYSLRGAVMRFEQIDGDFTTTAVTDHAGNIQMNADQLPVGNYKIYEEIAPEGMELDPTPQTVHWDGKRDVTLTFQNTRKMTLIISKQSSTTGYNLPGATFSVYRDGQYVTSVTTNEAGLAYFHDVKEGYWTVKETAAPLNHLLNEETQGVYINPYDPATTDDPRIVVKDASLPSLRIVKYNQTDHAGMEGVTFEIFRDGTSLGKFQTGRDGEILLPYVEPGTYRAVEVNTGDDAHILDTTPQEVELRAGDDVRELVFFNSLLPGVHLIKVNSADLSEAVPHAKFRFEKVGGGYGPVEYTTGADGTIDLSKLPVGSYVVTELECAGYVVDDTQRIIQLQPNTTAQFVFTNTKLPNIRLTKTDADGKPMEGVTFSLTSAGDGAHSDERATNAQGVITWEGLEPGLYSLVEVATKDTHVLDTTEHHVRLRPGKDAEVTLTNQIKPSFRVVKYNRTDYAGMEGVTFEIFRDGTSLGKFQTDKNGEILMSYVEPGTYRAVEVDTGDDAHILDTTPQEVELRAGDDMRELVFFNDLLPGVRLTKVDSADLSKPIPNAKFRFESVKGDFGPVEHTTGEDGTIDLSKLPVGSYIVTELECPGYVVDDGQRVIHLDGNENAEFVFTNTKFPNFTLTKTDTSGKPMEGVTFSLTPAGAGAHSDERTTNAQGVIVWEGLKPGLYSLVEVATKDTHVLDATEHHVRLYPGKDGKMTLTNKIKPSLRIVKYSRTSHTPLEGVTFKVFRDTVSLGKFQTNADGEILMSYVEPGTYRVAEVDTGDDAHILDTTPQEVELRAGEDVRELVFFDDLLPGVHLTKVDSADLSKPIANAKFRFESVKGDFGPVEYTTMADGTIDLSKLPVGSFIVTELECPGYVVDDGQRIIHLDGNENAEFVFTNSVLPSLHLTKTSADGTPLGGVSYRLAKIEDGSRYLDRTTSSTGEITWDGLEPGVYSLRETATVETHILDPKEYHVELYPGKVSEIVLENDRRPNLTIHKANADDSTEPVPDTVFIVKAADGSTIGEYKTGADGTVTIPNLLPQVVEIIEKSVPSPYLLDAPAQTITLHPNRDTDVYFKNHKAPTIEIIKESSITHNPIPNVRFQVWYGSNHTATGEMNDLGIFTTDANGRIDLTGPANGLRDGWFRVQELAPAPGYAIKDSDTQEAFIPAGKSHTFRFENTPLSAAVVWKYDKVSGAALGGCRFQLRYLGGEVSGSEGTIIGTYTTSKNGSFTVTGLKAGYYICEEIASDGNHVIDTAPQSFYISGKDQDIVTLYFGNAPKGALLVKKVSADEKKTPLADVEFLVTESDGTLVGNANGKFVTDSTGSFLVENVAPGTTLVVKEVRAKAGYLLDDTPQTATIQAGQTVSLEFRNQPLGNLVIEKLGRDGNKTTPLKGVKFEIKYADGRYVDAAGGKQSSNGIYYTNSSGKITLSGIVGTVVVTELESVEGYSIDPNTQSQTVTVNPDDTQTLRFYNNAVGGVEIIKVNEADRSERISNTTFEIRRMDGGLVDTITTGRNGRAYLSLEDGDYYAVEVKAGEGFKLDATPHYFTVKDGKTTTVTVTNRAFSGILLRKIDTTTKQGIYGATFLLYDTNRNPLGQYTSDDRGYVYIDNLPSSGRYYLRELANDGYVLDEQLKTVYVQPGETTEVTWENTPITGQIQLVKTSADYNPINGWAAGTPIPGTEYEVYDRAGVLVDTIRTDKNGVAATKALPLGRYTLVESKAADNYLLDKTPIAVEIEFAGQIVRAAATNKSVATGVSVTKTGYAEVMPGQIARYTLKDIANTSNVTLGNFYWRDTLPVESVRLTQIITGTWNVQGSYKLIYRTNLSGNDYRTLADNLSTRQNYTLDASPVALRLASNEYVTEVMAVFGTVPAGFRQVEQTQIDCTVVSWAAGGAQFANQADVGGTYNGVWVQATSRWVTKVYAPAKPLPRTGY